LGTSSAQPFTLLFHVFYFPGWQAYVDDQRVNTYPSSPLGLVTLSVPSGEHRVLLRFEDTALRRASLALSTLALAVLVILCVCRWKRALVIWPAALLLLIGLIAWGIGPVVSTKAPSYVGANLDGRVRLLGYALDRSEYPPGETIGVTLYWLGLREMAQDYSVFVHLVEESAGLRIAQHDGHPVYNSTPTSRWVPGEIVVDEHELTIGAETPPGRYRIFVGMYQRETGGRLPVLDEHGMPQADTIVLGTVEVTSPARLRQL
jgi:hypothetical protein